jgi:hypothetical protein
MRNVRSFWWDKKGTLKRSLVALIVTSGLVGVPVAVAVAPAAPAAAAAQRAAQSGSLGSTIASIAEGQEGVQDNPANTYCNPYSAYWGDGTKCSNGNRAVEWCADFAAWTWQQAGVSFTYGSGSSDINASASSFYSWAVANGTWHAAGSGYTPQPGDVAVYGNSGAAAEHVGVVVSNGSSGPNVVNGDWEIKYPSQFPTAVYYMANESSEAGVPLTGYASPPATSPLSSDTPTPQVASYVDPSGTYQVFTATATGVYETWWGGGTSLGTGRLNTLDATSVASYVDPSGVYQVITGTASGVYETWWGGGTSLGTGRLNTV